MRLINTIMDHGEFTILGVIFIWVAYLIDHSSTLGLIFGLVGLASFLYPVVVFFKTKEEEE